MKPDQTTDNSSVEREVIKIDEPLVYTEENDCTYYWGVEGAQTHLLGLDAQERQIEKAVSFTEICPATQKTVTDRRARAIIARCFAGKAYSLTARKQQIDKPELSYETKHELARRAESAEKNRRVRNTWNRLILPGHKFLVGADPLVDILFDHVFQNNPPGPARGLLIVSGQTGSGKSEVARRLLMKYLTEVKADRTPPHLVTFEDPIEEYIWPVNYVTDRANWPLPFDYTPRQKDIDVCSMKDTISAALRQTPAAVYIGETRKPRDWVDLVDFAGTGHLVVTTSHAGSLTECIDGLFRACKATTPSGRSEIGDRVLAIIHLRAHKIERGRENAEGKSHTVNCQIPALWRRTTQGSKLLMAEGLSAITPGVHENVARDQSSFGRSHFVDIFLKNPLKGEGLDSDEKKVELRRTCRDWDLAGE